MLPASHLRAGMNPYSPYSPEVVMRPEIDVSATLWWICLGADRCYHCHLQCSAIGDFLSFLRAQANVRARNYSSLLRTDGNLPGARANVYTRKYSSRLRTGGNLPAAQANVRARNYSSLLRTRVTYPVHRRMLVHTTTRLSCELAVTLPGARANVSTRNYSSRLRTGITYPVLRRMSVPGNTRLA